MMDQAPEALPAGSRADGGFRMCFSDAGRPDEEVVIGGLHGPEAAEIRHPDSADSRPAAETEAATVSR